MSGKHARPARPGSAGATGRSAGRRLAAGAIILAAGAAPLVAAAGAQAASAADPLGAATDAAGALPVIGDLPLGLSSLTAPADQAAPLASVLPAAQGMPMLDSALPLAEVVPALADTLPTGSLTGGSANGADATRLLPRAATNVPGSLSALAPLDLLGTPGAADPFGAFGSFDSTGSAAADPAGLTTFTQNSVAAVTDSASNTLGSVGQSVPGGGVGALTSGFTPQAVVVNGAVLRQASPVVNQLQQGGVPTVGDLTNNLGQSSLPMVGPVGHLTRTLPLSSVLGNANPLADTLSTATQL